MKMPSYICPRYIKFNPIVPYSQKFQSNNHQFRRKFIETSNKQPDTT